MSLELKTEWSTISIRPNSIEGAYSGKLDENNNGEFIFIEMTDEYKSSVFAGITMEQAHEIINELNIAIDCKLVV